MLINKVEQKPSYTIVQAALKGSQIDLNTMIILIAKGPTSTCQWMNNLLSQSSPSDTACIHKILPG